MKLPIIRPTLPPREEVAREIEESWRTGTVTVGARTRELEGEAARALGVREAIAVSSCTAGLMLVPQALELPPEGEVLLPSFTFTATGQPLLWNRLVPVFCDCRPGTLTLDPEDVLRNVTAKTVAICAATVYGLPPDVDELADVGRRKGLPVYYDSAQGLGATVRDRPVGGFGVCETFSLSPTKVVTAIEGGLVTTNDATLAARFRAMRDYGKDPNGGIRNNRSVSSSIS